MSDRRRPFRRSRDNMNKQIVFEWGSRKKTRHMNLTVPDEIVNDDKNINFIFIFWFSL